MKNSFIFNQIKKDFLWDLSYKITFFGQFVGMFLTLVTFFFLSKTFELSNSPYLQNYGNNYFLFSIIGIAFLDHISFFIRSSSLAIRNAQAFGYIDNIVNSNRSVFYVFLCMLLYPFLKGNLKFLIYIFFAAFFTSFELSFGKYLLVSFVLFLSTLFFIGIAFLSCSFVLVYKQADPINYFTNIIVTLLSGIIYPVSVLPNSIIKLSEVIPSTHSLEIIRMIIFSNEISLEISAIYSIFIAILIMLFSILMFKLSINKVKRDGSSGKY